MVQRKKSAGRGIQQELAMPGDEAYKPKKIKALENLATPFVELCVELGDVSNRLTEMREQMHQIMVKHEIMIYPLPNGGSLVRNINDKARYVPPKEKKDVAVAESNEVE